MISGISFGNKYVHEGAIFAEKEVREVARAVANAIEHDKAVRQLAKESDKYGAKTFARYDAPISQPAVDTSREISYGISHGIPQDGRTIVIA